VYEFCPRMDLFTYVLHGDTVANEELCHALFTQLLNSVCLLHNQCRLAHLDLKLENVVLDSHYNLKLIDFAFAEVKDHSLCVAKGTERYQAPEVARMFYQKQSWQDQGVPLTFVPE